MLVKAPETAPAPSVWYPTKVSSYKTVTHMQNISISPLQAHWLLVQPLGAPKSPG